ncbi:hypothetical protein KW477_19025, partial [Vibrio fluvialis]|nr:hypothetical protein [Vibrio fluvialis]
QQNKVNQTDGIWLSRHRLLLLKDKSGFPRKAAMNLFYTHLMRMMQQTGRHHRVGRDSLTLRRIRYSH